MSSSSRSVYHTNSLILAIFTIVLALLAGAGCNSAASNVATPTVAIGLSPTLPVVAVTVTRSPGLPTTESPSFATETPGAAITTGPEVTPTEVSANTEVPLPGTGPQVDLAGTEIQAFADSPQLPGVILAAGPGGVWRGASEPTPIDRSTTHWDDYNNWQSLPVKLSGQTTSAAIASPNIMYATSNTGCASGLPVSAQRSTDGGKTWQEIAGELAPLGIAAIDDKTAYGIVCGGVTQSTDSGATWTLLPGARLDNYDPHVIAASPDGQSIYVAYVSEGGSSRILRSTDSGAGWNEVTPKVEAGSQLSALSKIAFGSDTTGQPTIGIYMISGEGLWYLPPSTSEWKLLRKTNPQAESSEHITALYASTIQISANPDHVTIFIATANFEGGKLQGTGVLCSIDQGATWQQCGKSLDGRVVNDIAFGPFTHSHPFGSPGRMLAATNDGIWELEIPR